MKRFASILLTALLAAWPAAGETDYTSCFVPGEVVEYKIYWMGIPLAWSKTTTDAITEEGRDLIRIRMEVQTYAAYKHIFEVDDITEIIIDPKTALPLRHDWIINEGTIHKSHLTTFHHDQKVAIFQDRINMDIREVPIEAETREIFSFIYSHRNTDLETLAAGTYKLLVEGKIYDLSLGIRDTGTIKLPDYGKVPGIEIEPNADFDGIFLRQGKIFFWISMQTPRMVTCINTKVAVGKVSAKLHKVSGPGTGFWHNNK